MTELFDYRPRLGKVPLVLLALLLALAFVGLAVVGFGSFRAYVACPARQEISVALIALAAITPVCGCNVDEAVEEHGGNDWIFPLLLAMGLLMGWGSAHCDKTNCLTIGGDGVRYVGVILFQLGAALRVGAMRTLKNRFSVWVAIQKDHELHTTGLYRFIRHPSYTGAILNLVGWALAFRSVVGILLAAGMGLLLVTRIGAEEKLLISKFGEEYTEYQGRSWKLVPVVY